MCRISTEWNIGGGEILPWSLPFWQPMTFKKTQFWLYLTSLGYLLLHSQNLTQWGFDTFQQYPRWRLYKLVTNINVTPILSFQTKAYRNIASFQLDQGYFDRTDFNQVSFMVIYPFHWNCHSPNLMNKCYHSLSDFSWNSARHFAVGRWGKTSEFPFDEWNIGEW